MSYLNQYAPRGSASNGRAATKPKTPASQPLPGRAKDMMKNSHGSYVFQTEDWDQLMRFLILGTEGGSFYIGERALTLKNCEAAERCIRQDGKRVVDILIDVSDKGRALKPDPTLFVLAMAAAAGGKSPTEKDIEVRKYALSALPKIARTATHLYHWVGFVQGFRGWGRSLRATVANWYVSKRPDKLAYQAIKYKSRDGWSHRDVLRLSHPMTSDLALRAVLNYIAKPDESPLKAGVSTLRDQVNATKRGKKADLGLPLTKAALAKSFDEMDFGTKGLVQIAAAEELLHVTGSDKASVKQAIDLITGYNLPREVVPTHLQTNAAVWEALLNANMGLTAMIRSLNRMTAAGLLVDRSPASKLVLSKLRSADALREARIHPLSVLIALRQYAKGRGAKGSLSWSPVQKIVDALDEAFYASFKFVEPTGKDILCAVDVSGSMRGARVAGQDDLTADEVAAVMALVMINVEPNCELVSFDTSLRKLDISPGVRLDDVRRRIGGGGGTDITLPFKYAEQVRHSFNAIVSFTDSETWAGTYHAMDLLNAARRKHGMIHAINCATTANRATGLDPKAKGVLEVSGFDSALPQVISEFIKGDL